MLLSLSFSVLSLFVQRACYFLCLDILFCSFFVRPKKEPKKGRRKYQLQPFCPFATQGLKGATKKAAVRTIFGFAFAP
jgi:hypothetical protein